MRILILGAGKMGSFFTDILSFQHETAVFDVNPHQLRFVYNTYRFTTLEEIKEFEPELVINAVTVSYTHLDVYKRQHQSDGRVCHCGECVPEPDAAPLLRREERAQLRTMRCLS